MSTTATEAMREVAPPATEGRWNKPGARWKDVIRPYTKEEVERLRGTVKIEYTWARLGAERLWKLLQKEALVTAQTQRDPVFGFEMVTECPNVPTLFAPRPPCSRLIRSR